MLRYLATITAILSASNIYVQWGNEVAVLGWASALCGWIIVAGEEWLKSKGGSDV